MQAYKDRGQYSTEEYYGLSENANRHSKDDAVMYHSADIAPCASHVTALPHTPLTARALFDHNLGEICVARQQGDDKPGDDTFAPPDGDILGAFRGGREVSESKLLYEDNLSRGQDLQQDATSMCNEADHHTPGYQCALLDENIHAIVSPSWDNESSQVEEPSAWGGALAGVGEHFAAYPHQEYTGRDELIL